MPRGVYDRSKLKNPKKTAVVAKSGPKKGGRGRRTASTTSGATDRVLFSAGADNRQTLIENAHWLQSLAAARSVTGDVAIQRAIEQEILALVSEVKSRRDLSGNSASTANGSSEAKHQAPAPITVPTFNAPAQASA